MRWGAYICLLGGGGAHVCVCVFLGEGVRKGCDGRGAYICLHGDGG